MMRLNSIRTRTAMVLLSLGILIVLVIGGLWVYSTYVTIKNDISVSNLQDARLVSGYVGSFTHDIAGDEVVVAGSPYTIEAINGNDSERLRLIGDSLLSTIQGADIIIILDTEGNVLYHSKGASTTDFVTAGWYDAALKKNGTYITGLYYSNSLKNYVFSIAVPVMDHGSAIGYIVTSVQPETLNQAIQQQRINPDRNIFVVDNHGLVISHDNKTFVESNANFSYVLAVQKLMNGTEGVMETSQTYDGKLRIVGFSPVPGSGWGVIVSTPVSVVYSQIFQPVLVIFALLAGLSLLIIIISYPVSRRLTDPIVELSNTMRYILAGNYRMRARADRKDEIGDLSRTFNTMMDGLERTVELEHALELTKKYRLIFQGARDPIFFCDIYGKILDVNEAVSKAYGYTRDELLSMTVTDLRIPEERPKIRDTLKHCFEKGCVYETIHVRKDGSSSPVEISSAGTMIGERQVIVGVIRDITEHKHADELLAQAKDMLRLVMDNIPQAIFWKDIDSIYLGCNAVFARFAGVGDPENIKGKTDYDLPWTKVEAENFRRDDRKVMDTNIPLYHIVESQLQADGKHAWLDTNKIPLRNKEGKVVGVLGTYEDITDRLKADKALKDAKADAELYLDLMGHDISNINQIGIASLDLLKELYKLGKDEDDLASQALAAFKDSSDLISNVRKLQRARKGDLHLEKIDIGLMLEQVKDAYVNVPGREITINYKPHKNCFVLADKLLYDVFSNIVDNAIKHSKESVIINIDIGATTLDGREFYKVSIEDNGPGIAPEIKRRLFNRMYYSGGQVMGKGLGLYLAKTLLDAFKGEISVEDRVPGDHTKGSRFVVMLPTAEI